MNAQEVYNAIKQKYSDTRQYAIATEVGLSTGGSRRRIDVVVVNCYNSNSFRIDGIEIKVSKADLRRELEDPDKHVAFFELIDYYTLACPNGIADLSILPPKWGLLEVSKDGTARFARRPLALHDEVNRTVTRGFFAGYVRAIQQYAPSIEALDAEYKRGHADGREDMRRQLAYNQRRVEEQAKDLDEFYEIKRRFHMWGGEMEQRLDEFERFRTIEPELLARSLDTTINRLTKFRDVLIGGDA